MAITITRTSPLVAPTGAVASTGSTAGDLTDGKTYYYRIAALTAATYGRVGVPCAEISATADANGSIDLSWDAVAGASYYYVWRTPTSGNYSLDYNSNSALSHDTHSMLLNNQKTAATQNTLNTTSLTDLGTTTERSSSHAYYSWFHNAQLYENGRGLITLTTDSSSVGSFDDIYDDAVSNSYTAFFNKLYDSSGYRIFESVDDISINGDFADYNFKVIYHNQFIINSAYSTTFGKYVYISATASYWVCGHWELINYCPVGRKMTNNLTFYNCNLYGGRCYRDWGIANEQSYTVSNIFYIPSGAAAVNDTTMKECTFAGCWQQININGTVDFDNIIFERNHRGFSINADQASSNFNNVFFNNGQFETTGNYAATLKGCTLYNGSGTNIHRFYNITDLNRTLLDCVFPNGNGLPASASQAFGTGNILTLQWSFNLEVLDIDGNVIGGATVLIEDSKGNSTSLTTDVNGVITEQELTQAVYSRSTDDDGNFDTTDSYNPYNITISKSGYKTYKSEFELNDKTSLKIKLEKNRFREDRSRKS